MSPSALKLRSGLIISRQGTDGNSAFIIKDPVTGRFFRFRQAEYSIAQQLDGSTPLHVVERRFEEQFGATLGSGEIVRFVERLDRLGLLERESKQPDALPPKKRVRGSLLYLRFLAFDPNRLLERLAPKFRFFFTPYFLFLSIATILCGLATTVLEWNAIVRDVRNLWRFDLLLMAWLAMLCVTAMHEFAHGLTCKHFRGDVHEMGFLLIYFQPAFYCNVSDAWLFPEKSRRLWVTFAGAYFEIFLWALATIIWRLVEPGNWVSFLALVIMATSGIKSLFNLNPLIKLDGYYLLSDYLEVPNLRKRSFDYLRSRFKELITGIRIAHPDEPNRRERRIYTVYGLLAGLYSYTLLYLVAVSWGRFLVARYQVYGLLLFGSLLLVAMRNPLYTASRKVLAPVRSRLVKVTGARRKAIRLALAAAALSAIFLGHMDLKVAAEFKILPIQNANVRAEVAGIIHQIYVDEAQVVHKGDLVARLSDRDLLSELKKVEAASEEAAAKLRMLKKGPRREEIEVARKSVETSKTRVAYAGDRYGEAKRTLPEKLVRARASFAKAEEEVKYARSHFATSRALFEQQLLSRDELNKSAAEMGVKEKQREEAEADLKILLADELVEPRTGLAMAQKEWEEAQGKLNLLLAGSRPEEVDAAQAEVTNLEAQRHYLQEQLRLTTLVSPITGVVTTSKPKELVGQHVDKGDLIVNVHELDTVRAEILSEEKEIADVKPGQQVALKARAFPRKTFYGTVASIAPVATDGPLGKTVLVSCLIDNASAALRPEMTGMAKIYCGKRRISELLARRLTHYLRVDFWSLW